MIGCIRQYLQRQSFIRVVLTIIQQYHLERRPRLTRWNGQGVTACGSPGRQGLETVVGTERCRGDTGIHLQLHGQARYWCRRGRHQRYLLQIALGGSDRSGLKGNAHTVIILKGQGVREGTHQGILPTGGWLHRQHDEFIGLILGVSADLQLQIHTGQTRGGLPGNHQGM